MTLLRRSALMIAFAAIDLTAVDLISVRTSNGAAQHFRVGEARATVVVFVSAVCPMSVEYSERLTAIIREYSSKDIRFVLVNSNVNETDSEVEAQGTAAKLPVPVFRDGGKTAAQLGATATPTAVVVDRNGAIQYFGMIDNSRDPARVTKPLLRSALDAVLAGRPIAVSRTKVIGCSIKPDDAP